MSGGTKALWLGAAMSAALTVALAEEPARTPAMAPTQTPATEAAQSAAPAPAAEQEAAPAAAGGDEPLPYTVVCDADGKNCAVDKNTYVGWRTYHATCFQCHAQDAVGSTFAPNLLVRLKTVDHARFENSVRNGFQGQIGVMPAWKDDPNVAPHIEQLYAYLRARSDGALPPGKPKRLK